MHAQNYNSLLPSVEANYRVTTNASIYGQYGRGSIAPFSSVFDTQGAETAVTPPADHRRHLSGWYGGQAAPLRLRRGCLLHPLHELLLHLHRHDGRQLDGQS